MDNETKLRRFCDDALLEASLKMVNEGADMGLILDRVFTFGMGHTVKQLGAVKAAAAVHDMAEGIERGVFDHIEALPKARRN